MKHIEFRGLRIFVLEIKRPFFWSGSLQCFIVMVDTPQQDDLTYGKLEGDAYIHINGALVHSIRSLYPFDSEGWMRRREIK